jgi:hypothetical protein
MVKRTDTALFSSVFLFGLFVLGCGANSTPASSNAASGSGETTGASAGSTTAASGGGTGATGGSSAVAGGGSGDATSGAKPSSTGAIDAAAEDQSVPDSTGGSTDAARAAVDASAESAASAASANCPAGALVCDDFEGYALGSDLSPNWTTEIMGGTVQVETSKPFRGTKGVRITTTLSPANEPVRTNGGPLRAATLIKQAPLFPIAGNAFYGRVMIWLTDMPPGGVHFSNIEASGKFPDGRLVKYGEGGMFQKLMAGYTIRPMGEFDLPTVDCAKTSNTGVPVKRWVCVEWQFNGSNDEMHLWFDGQAQTPVDIVKTGGGCSVPWKAPVFDKLFLGWRHSQPSSIDVEMWLDDVVIDTKRVGCPAPP